MVALPLPFLPTNLMMLSNSGRCFLSLILVKGKQTLGQPLPLPRIMFLIRCQLTPSHSKVVLIIVGILPRAPGQRKDLRKLPALFGDAPVKKDFLSLGFQFSPQPEQGHRCDHLDCSVSDEMPWKIFKGVGILSIYNQARAAIDTSIQEREQHALLKTWVSWWHDRLGFICRAFAPKDSLEMNQAEVIRAGWAHEICQILAFSTSVVQMSVTLLL